MAESLCSSPETVRTLLIGCTPIQNKKCVCVFKSTLHTPPIPVAIPGGSVVRNLPANAGDVGSIPGWERSLGERNGNPLQYSCLGDPMDRGSWEAAVHGDIKESDRTQ